MNKILILAMVFLMVGVVSADRSLSNVVGVDMPSNIVAGSPFEANFSFDYYDDGENEAGSPLIIKLDVVAIENYSWCDGADTNKDGIVDVPDFMALKMNMGNVCGSGICEGDLNGDGIVDWEDLNILWDNFGRNCSENGTKPSERYPVWKGDFVISGEVQKRWIGDLLHIRKIVKFNCSEEDEQTIEHPLDAQNVTAPNGTFYCYNEAGDLELNKNDKVTLDIVSNQALYPGKYNLSASMFYLTDERGPFVNITNKDLFDLYYRELDNIEVWATIDDGSEIKEYPWGTIFANYDITVPFSHKTLGINYFTKVLPIDIVEGDYDLFIFAEDEYNNLGNNSVTLKIDRTAPEIVLIEWDKKVQSGNMTIEVNVTDIKAGLNNSAVEYRLREMDGNNTCPEDGVGTWDCYNSGWLSLPNTSGDLFGLEVNTTEVGLNGEYWLQVRASDILGNVGILE